MHNPLSLRELADNVRAWAAVMIQNQAFDHEDQKFKLEATVQLFESKADCLEELRRQSWMESFGRHGFQRRFKMLQLLRLVILVKDVRTATRTKQVLVSSLRSLFPAEESSYLENVVADDSLVPGKSVLYNMRFIVDMALMLHIRGFLADNFGVLPTEDLHWPAVYLLVDSSPQGGKNLLNSEYDVIAADDLLKLGDVFLEVCALVGILRGNSEGMRASDVQQFLDEHDALLEQARGMIRHHCNIPVVLGSKHSTVLHEFVALEHAIFMETGSSAVLSNFNKCVVSTTTDRGTEKSLVRVPPMQFQVAFPFFLPEEQLQFEVDAGGAEPAPEGHAERLGPQAPASVSPDDLLCLSDALDVAGPMHALSNASRGFVYAMPNYESYFYPRLNAVVRFLHAPYYRALFSHKCLVGNLEPLKDLLESFPWTIVKWRWLSLTAVVPEILLRQHALTAAWSLEALGINQRDRSDNAGDDEFHGMCWDLVDAAIQDSRFWAWLRMLSVLTAILGYLERWFFQCPCHAEEASMENLMHVVSAPLPARENNRRVDKPLHAGCPFRTRRGPELAAGDFLRMLEQLLAASNQEVVGGILVHLSPQDQGKVVEDFEAAKQHLLFRMRVQFAVWTSLPRLLLGLGHTDPQQARRCAVQALVQYEGYSQQQKQQAHHLTKMFCDAQGTLRPVMRQFIAGIPLVRLPLLRSHLLRLAFIPLCEMSVERMHAVTKSVISHGSASASMPSLSLGNRWPELLKALQEPNKLQWFSDVCTQVYHPLRACPIFGILHHPDLVNAFNGVADISLLGLLGSTFKWSKIVMSIIYRSSFSLQFQDVSACRPPPDEPKVAVAPLHVPVADSLEERLLNIECMEAFSQEIEPGTFYSVPTKLNMSPVPSELVVLPLLNRLRPIGHEDVDLPVWLQRECDVECPVMEVDVSGAEAGCQQTLPVLHRENPQADHMFFQVVSSRPARVKQDRAVGVGFLADDVAVTRHVCLKLAGNDGGICDPVADAKQVDVEAMAAHGLVCQANSTQPEEDFNWILPRSQASHIRQALVWEHSDCVRCLVDSSFNIPPDVVALMEHALDDKALPHTSFVLRLEDCSDEDHAVLKKNNPKFFRYIVPMLLSLLCSALNSSSKLRLVLQGCSCF